MILKKIYLLSIRLYQRVAVIIKIFFAHLLITDRNCRFTPTCSQYAYQAVKKYGILRGSWLGFKRILKCHPFSSGGLDPLK